MCTISITELKQNLHKYVALSADEQIIVTSHGQIVTMLSNPKGDKYDNFLAMRGILKGCVPNDDYEKALDERDMNR